MENGEGPVPRTSLLGVKGEAQAAAAPAEDRPFPAPLGPRTVMERPWEGSQVPRGGGTRGLAGASRCRGALRCCGGWHRLAATGWVPGYNGRSSCFRPRMLCVVGLLPSPAGSSPAPRAVTVYSAPGCTTTRGARPGRRVSVQHWVFKGHGTQSSLEELPWDHYLCPLAWSSWAFPGGLWEGKAGDSRLDAGSWLLGVGTPGTPPASPLRATPLQGSLPQSCCQTS